MSSEVANSVIIGVLVVVIVLAIKYSIPHFKGEGSCCGGGGKAKLLKRQKLDRVLYTKRVMIQGMMCDSCAARVHNALNSIDGINAKVVRSKDMAIIKYGTDIDDEKIRGSITDLGYTVKEIKML